MIHRLNGSFEKRKDQLSLVVDIQAEDLFDKIKHYIVSNMFIAYRRPAARFRRIVIHSIGDNLTEDEQQIIQRAEIYLDIQCPQTLSKEEYNCLVTSDKWLVEAIHKQAKGKKKLSFSIEKPSDLINHRDYKET
jgi:hypothetical protein